MTTEWQDSSLALPAAARARAARPQSDLELAARQLAAIERFNDGRRLADSAAAAAARSREMRMDASRRMEVLRRQHAAVIARAHEQLQATGELLGVAGDRRRVVLAHRSEWFLDRVATARQDRGLAVVARLDNGADAVGLSLCEQPDLVLVEDRLAMVPGVDVVRELREVCPATRILAHCEHGSRVGPLLEAGAEAVYTRRVTPSEVAAAMYDLIA